MLYTLIIPVTTFSPVKFPSALCITNKAYYLLYFFLKKKEQK